MKALFRTTDSMAPCFARIALGIVFFPHGAQKVLGWFGGPGYAATMETFATKLHFLPILVVLLMATEFLGSLFLIAGFMTRVWAFGIGVAMSICAYGNHLQHGFFMNWFGTQKGEGFEFHILAVGLALSLMVSGGGKASLDRMIGGGKRK